MATGTVVGGGSMGRKLVRKAVTLPLTAEEDGLLLVVATVSATGSGICYISEDSETYSADVTVGAIQGSNGAIQTALIPVRKGHIYRKVYESNLPIFRAFLYTNN